MTRNHVFLFVGASLCALGVAQLLGGGCSCSPIHVHWSSMTSKDGVELPHEATLHLSSPEKLSRLTLALETASIEVTGDPAVTGLEADVVVRERTPGDASLVATAQSFDVKSAGGNPVLVTSAKVRVPAGTEIDVGTEFGAVTVTGIKGVASVGARTESGGVHLREIHDVPKVTGSSSFGAVTFEGGSGLGEVALETSSGHVEAATITGSKSVTLKSDFGGVTATSVTATDFVSLTTDSGAVRVEDVKTARATLKSEFGSVNATRSTFDHVSAHTDSGGVRLTNCTYKTKDLGTEFGSVKEE